MLGSHFKKIKSDITYILSFYSILVFEINWLNKQIYVNKDIKKRVYLKFFGTTKDITMQIISGSKAFTEN